nr:hypothetical protein [Kibdelosporangium sp. MJ126-NF4]CTQ90586.1 hypothetical protein [Kibdelosporangium sp. MJ126-NF4]
MLVSEARRNLGVAVRFLRVSHPAAEFREINRLGGIAMHYKH